MADNQSLSINIPNDHYVTFHFRDNDIYPLGFLVPDGKDKASQNRKATADRWANGSKVKVPAKIFSNKPMVGFEIRKSVRYRSRGGSKETWRIIDPRGFELEISNSNMEFIIDHCILDKGEIISSCIWGRDGSENLLLPVDCDEYKAASLNTERHGKKASMRDVKIGDHVTFKKGNKARYLGKYFKYSIQTNEYEETNEMIIPSNSKAYVFLNPDNTILISSSVQVSEINKSEPITEAEAEMLANKLARESCSKYRYSDSVVALSIDSVEFDGFEKTKVQYKTCDDGFNDGYFHSIAQNGTSSRWIVDNRRSHYGHGSNKDNITVSEILADDIEDCKVSYILVPRSGYYGGNQMGPKKSSIDAVVFENQYTVEGIQFKHISSLGNEIIIKL